MIVDGPTPEDPGYAPGSTPEACTAYASGLVPVFTEEQRRKLMEAFQRYYGAGGVYWKPAGRAWCGGEALPFVLPGRGPSADLVIMDETSFEGSEGES